MVKWENKQLLFPCSRLSVRCFTWTMSQYSANPSIVFLLTSSYNNQTDCDDFLFSSALVGWRVIILTSLGSILSLHARVLMRVSSLSNGDTNNTCLSTAIGKRNQGEVVVGPAELYKASLASCMLVDIIKCLLTHRYGCLINSWKREQKICFDANPWNISRFFCNMHASCEFLKTSPDMCWFQNLLY